MELKLFIDKLLTENNKPCSSKDVDKVYEYICDMARKQAEGKNSIGIDDETVKKWVLDFDFASENVEKEESKEIEESVKCETTEEPKSTYKPIEIKHRKFKEEKSEGTWGKQESLF